MLAFSRSIRWPPVSRGALRSVAAAALIGLTAPGCVTLFRHQAVTSTGLARDEATARQLLASGQADSVAGLIERRSIDPGDDLLRGLYSGLTLYHAGQYERATDEFERAKELSDDRVTKSVSRSVLSIVSNDRVLPYVPSATERLLIPYYAALSYLQTNDISGAAVEARRLSLALERSSEPVDVNVRRVHAMLSYVAGAIFESAGEFNDAAVAYRRAAAYAPGLVSEADTLGLQDGRWRGDSVDVLVLVEHGYTAPRVEASLHAWLGSEVFYALTASDEDGRAHAAVRVASRLAAARDGRVHLESLTDLDEGGEHRRRRRHDADDDDGDTAPYLLKVAWPVLGTTASAATLDVHVRSALPEFVPFHASVAGSLAQDFRAQQTLVLARAVLRGAAKLALVKAAEKEVSEKDETAGAIVGFLANAGAVLTEHADTRAWSLLPAMIALQRIRLPAGQTTVQIEVNGRTVERPVRPSFGGPAIIDVRTW